MTTGQWEKWAFQQEQQKKPQLFLQEHLLTAENLRYEKNLGHKL